MKKILFILISMVILVSCTKEDTILPQPQILNATCQKWYGGHQETGRGSLYFIYVKTDKSIDYQKLKTDSLYTIGSREFGDTTIICLRTYTRPLCRFGMLYFNTDSIEVNFDLVNEINYP